MSQADPGIPLSLKKRFVLDPTEDVISVTNRNYAGSGETPMELDIFVPKKGKEPFPLIVWIPGGAWLGGDKGGCLPLSLGFCQKGFAVAGLSYRSSSKAPFPAQLNDLKVAVRWIRVHAEDFNIDANRIGAAGTSAGGHLACLLGVTGKTTRFDCGEHLEQSSAVQAVCNFYGATNFLNIFEHLNRVRGKSTFMREMVGKLLGDPLLRKTDLAEQASPITYVDGNSPPFLTIHGTEDRTVPFIQAELFHNKLRQNDVESRLLPIPGADHGNDFLFAGDEWYKEIFLFFDEKLRDQSHRMRR